MGWFDKDSASRVRWKLQDILAEIELRDEDLRKENWEVEKIREIDAITAALNEIRLWVCCEASRATKDARDKYLSQLSEVTKSCNAELRKLCDQVHVPNIRDPDKEFTVLKGFDLTYKQIIESFDESYREQLSRALHLKETVQEDDVRVPKRPRDTSIGSAARRRKFISVSKKSLPNHPPVIPINSLNLSWSDWSIIARVIYKGKLVSHKVGRHTLNFFFFDLFDNSGEIRATSTDDRAIDLHRTTEVGGVYLLFGAILSLANPHYDHHESQLKIQIPRPAQMVRIPDDDSIRQLEFNFLSIADIKRMGVGLVVDVAGKVDYVGPCQTVKRRTRNGVEPLKRQILAIVDATERILVHIFGELCDYEGLHLFENQSRKVPQRVEFRFVKIDYFEREIKLHSISPTRIYINREEPEEEEEELEEEEEEEPEEEEPDSFMGYASSFEEPVRTHIIDRIINVRGDGNCGFRAIALSLDYPEEDWKRIRTELLNELSDKKGFYQGYYVVGHYQKVKDICSFFDDRIPAPESKWFDASLFGHLVATRYQAVVVLLGTDQYITFLPLTGRPSGSERIICLSRVSSCHYVQIVMKTTDILPPLGLGGRRFNKAGAREWKQKYSGRCKRWVEIDPQEKQTDERRVGHRNNPIDLAGGGAKGHGVACGAERTYASQFISRLMMNPQTKKNKGFAFLHFASVEQTNHVVSELKAPIVHGRQCGVAMEAFRHLQQRDVFLGTDHNVKVAFADSFTDPDDEIMAQAKTIFIDGLPAAWDEDHVESYLEKHGQIEKIELAGNTPSAKRKDFGFVTFSSHDNAVDCGEGINNKELGEGGNKVTLRARLSRLHQEGRGKRGIRGVLRISCGPHSPPPPPRMFLRGGTKPINGPRVPLIGWRIEHPIPYREMCLYFAIPESSRRMPPPPERHHDRRQPPAWVTLVDHNLPKYGHSRDYDSLSGSMPPYSELDNVPPQYADVSMRQSRPSLEYGLGGGSAQYDNAYYDSCSSLSSHDKMCSICRGMNYGGGSVSGSDDDGM